MTLPTQHHADAFLFFRLDVPIPALRSFFAGVQNFTPLGPERAVEVAPGVSFGSPMFAIAQYKHIRIEYLSERFMLRNSGPLEELVELINQLPTLLEKQGYMLKDIVRYYEFDTQSKPMIADSVVDRVRANTQIDLSGLSKACGEELKPYMLWVSNLDTPLSDKWLNITLQPEVNSPHKRLIWRIVKRTETFKEFSEFLMRTEEIIKEIERMFGAS